MISSPAVLPAADPSLRIGDAQDGGHFLWRSKEFAVRSILSILAVLTLSAIAIAERPLLLVTPKGVWKSEVTENGPGPWVAQNIDVIVQGFGPGNDDGPPNDPPEDPPITDPLVAKLAEIGRLELKDKSQATACAALVSSLVKMGLPSNKLKEALELSAPILDTQLKAEGRITKWVKAVVAVSVDSKKIIDSLVIAWDIELSTLETITSASMQSSETPVPAEALDWAVIIQVIQMIIQLLQSLGII